MRPNPIWDAAIQPEHAADGVGRPGILPSSEGHEGVWVILVLVATSLPLPSQTLSRRGLATDGTGRGGQRRALSWASGRRGSWIRGDSRGSPEGDIADCKQVGQGEADAKNRTAGIRTKQSA